MPDPADAISLLAGMGTHIGFRLYLRVNLGSDLGNLSKASI